SCDVTGTGGLSSMERCMYTMQTGTQMSKLKGKKNGLIRFFYLDEHKSCIRWRPSKKQDKAKITIDSIQEVCEGKKSEMFRRYADNRFDPNCCFSIYHGERVKSLDLVTTNAEEARTWVTGLKYLMAGISDEDSLARRQRTRDQYPLSSLCCTNTLKNILSRSCFSPCYEIKGRTGSVFRLNCSVTWLQQTFSEADKNGDGTLSIGEVHQLLHKLNVNLPKQKVRQMFQDADTDENQGSLGFEEFCSFYKMISTRRDLYLIMISYSNQKEVMDLHDLARFLENEQKMRGLTKEHLVDIVAKFEPCPENLQHMVLGIDGFTNFMRSPAGDIFNPEHNQVNQDMTQALNNYFIATSHNTYLSGDQLLSQSRVEMYAYVLQAGCRCVEVDCWDGPDGEPIIHHGYTLTSKILFKDVIETIDKYAFTKSQYPVILSIENHCSVPQQKKMAEYLKEVLQDKLDLSVVISNDCKKLPSPEILKGKVLIKGKKLPANIDPDAEEGDVSDEDTGDEEEEEAEDDDQQDGNSVPLAGSTKKKRRLGRSIMRSFKRKVALRLFSTDVLSLLLINNAPFRKRKTMRLSRALSDLVIYTKSVRVHDIETQAFTNSWQVSSLNETVMNQILQLKPDHLVRFNQRQLLRVYPSNYRVDSSNFNPQPYWNTGCHMVALNYQTEGRMLELNTAKFSANGNCGYILKPKYMRKGAFNPTLEDPLPGRRKTQLVLKIISGQQLPKPKDSMLGDRGEIIDPFVEVEIIGLPLDCSKQQTRVVDDNGFNPMWEETLVFNIQMPEVALVRFQVWDHDPIGRDFIGQRTIALTSMMPGYRHVYLEGMATSSIFLHIAIIDLSGKVRDPIKSRGIFSRMSSTDSHHMGSSPSMKDDSFDFDSPPQTSCINVPAPGSQNAIQEEFENEHNDSASLTCAEQETDRTHEPERPEQCQEEPQMRATQPEVETDPVPQPQPVPHPQIQPEDKSPPLIPPSSPARVRRTLGTPVHPLPSTPVRTKVRSHSCPRKQTSIAQTPTALRRHPIPNGLCLSDSTSSSSNVSTDSQEFAPSSGQDGAEQREGTLQREMKALFDQRLREIRCKSPLFFLNGENCWHVCHS
uniref:Phosphoinositide phospholipase C n=1 Tax=Takifugu rubripes TaxID=31033 RepID=H2UH10_TAKRU